MTFAKMAMKTTEQTTARPMTAPRFSRKERQKAKIGPGGAAMTRVSVAMADPWIDQAIEKVDNEVHQNDDAGDQHDAALKGGIVAAADGFNQPFAGAEHDGGQYEVTHSIDERALLAGDNGINQHEPGDGLEIIFDEVDAARNGGEVQGV